VKQDVERLKVSLVAVKVVAVVVAQVGRSALAFTSCATVTNYRDRGRAHNVHKHPQRQKSRVAELLTKLYLGIPSSLTFSQGDF
jgi:hypothetical protein